MGSTHEADLAVPAAVVWDWLTGDGVLQLAPVWSLERQGDGAEGSVTVRLGSSQVTYRVTVTGHATSDRGATLTVTGKEARGSGTVTATVELAVTEAQGRTHLAATVDADATGRAEAATAAAWQRGIDRMLSGVSDALLEPVASTSAPEVADDVAGVTQEPPPRAPVAVSPPPPMLPPPASPTPKVAMGALALLLGGLLFRAMRRRRRSSRLRRR